MILSPRI